MSRGTATRNGQSAQTAAQPTPEEVALAAAVASEQLLADEAAEVRGDALWITPELFAKLLPLLRRPIPAGFIKTIGVVTGKPYESTGIRSVQVQIDRMDNVLTPLGWREKVEYLEGGKLCEVTVQVIGDRDEVLAERTSMGGVDRASTIGNLYKGSYTNAAKVAFARIGPGHEVYVGATDLDPDVSEAAAKEQGKGPRTDAVANSPADADAVKISKERALQLADSAFLVGCEDKLQLAASHAHGGEDVGDCSSVPKATTALMNLTVLEGLKVEQWINRKAEEAAVADVERETPDA